MNTFFAASRILAITIIMCASNVVFAGEGRPVDYYGLDKTYDNNKRVVTTGVLTSIFSNKVAMECFYNKATIAGIIITNTVVKDSDILKTGIETAGFALDLYLDKDKFENQAKLLNNKNKILTTVAVHAGVNYTIRKIKACLKPTDTDSTLAKGVDLVLQPEVITWTAMLGLQIILPDYFV
ncbi:MAG TPA: hypothetical protein VLB80_03535 [Candidatus Babeliales bacterium]|nr:hypothetical protein [Candidatus Babeliales bacterium]